MGGAKPIFFLCEAMWMVSASFQLLAALGMLIFHDEGFASAMLVFHCCWP
jgi:hypothetical protein